MKITLNNGTSRTIEVERINGLRNLCFALSAKERSIMEAYYLAELYGGKYVEYDKENNLVWVCNIEDQYVEVIEL